MWKLLGVYQTLEHCNDTAHNQLTSITLSIVQEYPLHQGAPYHLQIIGFNFLRLVLHEQDVVIGLWDLDEYLVFLPPSSSQDCLARMRAKKNTAQLLSSRTTKRTAVMNRTALSAGNNSQSCVEPDVHHWLNMQQPQYYSVEEDSGDFHSYKNLAHASVWGNSYVHRMWSSKDAWIPSETVDCAVLAHFVDLFRCRHHPNRGSTLLRLENASLTVVPDL
jgi:hypothetical protein